MGTWTAREAGIRLDARQVETPTASRYGMVFAEVAAQSRWIHVCGRWLAVRK
jgi:hypothetical protein